jgi:predicted XRE-type DNA-binding protein
MSAHTEKRKGKANGKKRIRAKSMKRALSVWELYQNDVSQYKIAERLGITQPRVSQILRETYKKMEFDVHEIAAHELVKEVERCRIYAEKNMARALTDPRTADTLLRWLQHKSLLLGLAGTKVSVSGSINHTTNLSFDTYSSEDLACLEYLIAKGSGMEFDTSKRCILIDSDPLLALEYKPTKIEEFDNEIEFDGKPQRAATS